MLSNCTICSDLFDGVNSIIATPCGHVFHEICCLQWLEHSRTCPACRKKITPGSVLKLYFTYATEDAGTSEDDNSKLKNELETLKANLKLKEMEKRKLLMDMDDLRKAAIKAEDQADLNHQKSLDYQGQVTATRLQVKQLVKEKSMLQNVADENKRLYNQLNHLKNVQSIVDSCQNEVSTMLSSCGDASLSTRETATYITLLKRELQSSREARTKLANELRGIKHDLGVTSSHLKEVTQELQKSKCELRFFKEALETLESDSGHRTPASASKRKFTSPDTSIKENISTPFKRPKMNMVSAVVNMVHEKAEPVQQPLQATVSVPQTSLFRPQNNSNQDDSSVISEGYNGLGGHTKFVSRSAPLKMKFTSLNKKPSLCKTQSNPTLHKFLSL